jgi:hypothetical protein
LALASSQLDVMNIARAVLSQNREVVNLVERMVWIPNRDFDLVTGIIPCRLQPDTF